MVQHADMVFAAHVDAHRSSNAWLKQAYAWALRHHTSARWFIKVDDDVYVHVQKLALWLGAINSSWWPLQTRTAGRALCA